MKAFHQVRFIGIDFVRGDYCVILFLSKLHVVGQ